MKNLGKIDLVILVFLFYNFFFFFLFFFLLDFTTNRNLINKNFIICYKSLNDEKKVEIHTKNLLTENFYKKIYVVTSNKLKFDEIKMIVGPKTAW
jgi:hypothetical protein